MVWCILRPRATRREGEAMSDEREVTDALREIAEQFHEGSADEVALRYAADEIERLRAERCEASRVQYVEDAYNEVNTLRKQLATCRRLLIEAMECDPKVVWFLSRQWHTEAARAAGGGGDDVGTC